MASRCYPLIIIEGYLIPYTGITGRKKHDKKVGVVGAGQMGRGIAHIAALAGYDVLLHDISDTCLKTAMATIENNMACQVAAKKLNEEQRVQALSCIRPLLAFDEMADADLVIEAVTKNENIKQDIFNTACRFLKPVRGIATDDATFEMAKAFVSSLRKTVTVTQDFPAFIVHRILLPMINEAIYTLYEGVGTVDAIDTALRLGANHRMGPL